MIMAQMMETTNISWDVANFYRTASRNNPEEAIFIRAAVSTSDLKGTNNLTECSNIYSAIRSATTACKSKDQNSS